VVPPVTPAVRARGGHPFDLIDAVAALGTTSIGCSELIVLIPVREEATLMSHLLSQDWAVRSGEASRLGSKPFRRAMISSLLSKQATESTAAFAAD